MDIETVLVTEPPTRKPLDHAQIRQDVRSLKVIVRRLEAMDARGRAATLHYLCDLYQKDLSLNLRRT